MCPAFGSKLTRSPHGPRLRGPPLLTSFRSPNDHPPQAPFPAPSFRKAMLEPHGDCEVGWESGSCSRCFSLLPL